MSTPTNSSASADHLCVLVHGLWGNPDHLKSLTNSLHERYSEDRLHVLVTKRNSGSFTYDGAEIGGERAVVEIEEKLQELEKAGHNIRKISIVGYSFGGLVARYAVGLLYHHGLFERIQPVNFTTFATPHLGVRTPLRGYHSHIWNVLGARTLSMSGRQLFGIDKFRDTGRSLLAVLADPESIFIKGLAQFEYRSLYANVVNDRTVTYYTAAISQTDPFVRVDDLQVNYIPGYQDVIVDRENPVSPKGPEEPKALAQRITSGTRLVLGRVAITAALAVFLPIGITGFLLNSVVQTVRSGQRIQLHTEGRAGIDPTRYRIPLMINAVRHEAEQVFESANNSQPQDYLSAGSEDMASPTQPSSPGWTRRKSSVAKSSMDMESVEEQKSGLAMEFPTLALTQDQFKMIEALDNVGFKKHPVYIHKHRHSHAAIIVRMDKESHHEGKMVIKHWLDNFSL